MTGKGGVHKYAHELRMKFQQCSSAYPPKIPTSGQPQGFVVGVADVVELFVTMATALVDGIDADSTDAQKAQCVKGVARRLKLFLRDQWPKKETLFNPPTLLPGQNLEDIIDKWKAKHFLALRGRNMPPDAGISPVSRFGLPIPCDLQFYRFMLLP